MDRKTKILIVEDEAALADLMVLALNRAGHEAETVNSGKRAMKLATQNRFDLITLDIKLPDTSGFEVCRELKQRHISYKTPIIFISGSHAPEDIAESKKCGAVDYIVKPFDITEFIHKVVYYARARKQAEGAPK
jgi:DNA-binding response OmpR family regulator